MVEVEIMVLEIELMVVGTARAQQQAPARLPTAPHSGGKARELPTGRQGVFLRVCWSRPRGRQRPTGPREARRAAQPAGRS